MTTSLGVAGPAQGGSQAAGSGEGEGAGVADGGEADAGAVWAAEGVTVGTGAGEHAAARPRNTVATITRISEDPPMDSAGGSGSFPDSCGPTAATSSRR